MSTRIARNDATVCRTRLGRLDTTRAVQARRLNDIIRPSPFALRPSPFPKNGFTLVELLVTVTIIAILAAVVLAALNAARQTARAAKTKATIAKLDQVIMRRYDSYMTRRVPISTSGVDPRTAAQRRLDAIRDLMRMELPERMVDISSPNTPCNFGWGNIERPALSTLYLQRGSPSADYRSAELLYMIVSIGNSQDMEHFSQSEIGDVDIDGYPEFIDGWGRPIMFLRWAPGFSYRTDLGFTGDSGIQSGDPVEDHGPFDTHNLEPGAYHLFPLIYSGGSDGQYDLDLDWSYEFDGSPYQVISNGHVNNTGAPLDADGDGLNHYDNIHNHRIEAR